jgi:hypothetical protein
MNKHPPLGWPELSAIGRWIIHGPRSLVTSAEPTGGKMGWLDRLMHWRRYPLVGGVQESCTVYRRFEFEGAKLPLYVARFAQWESGKDRELCLADNAHELTVSVKHYVYPGSALASIHLQEQRLTASLAATVADELMVQHQPASVYHWDFPGTIVKQTLQWTSSTRTEALERLWHETVPKDVELEVIANLIERFGIATFNEYIDVIPDELPTVHHRL